jgi:hypothetical protein
MPESFENMLNSFLEIEETARQMKETLLANLVMLGEPPVAAAVHSIKLLTRKFIIESCVRGKGFKLTFYSCNRLG